jgi:hypothetical protein
MVGWHHLQDEIPHRNLREGKDLPLDRYLHRTGREEFKWHLKRENTFPARLAKKFLREYFRHPTSLYPSTI